MKFLAVADDFWPAERERRQRDLRQGRLAAARRNPNWREVDPATFRRTGPAGRWIVIDGEIYTRANGEIGLEISSKDERLFYCDSLGDVALLDRRTDLERRGVLAR